MLERSTPSQLLPLAASVRAFLAWCTAHRQSYTAVVVTRFDVYLKTDMHSLLGSAQSVDGFRLLWREAGGHWRHHSDPSTAERTFSTKPWRDWRRQNPRAPDAVVAFQKVPSPRSWFTFEVWVFVLVVSQCKVELRCGLP